MLEGKLYLCVEGEQTLQPLMMLIGELSVLTEREKEVLQWIADGLSNNQIATKLFISPLTVDSHRKKLLTKPGVNNTASLIRIVVEHRLL